MGGSRGRGERCRLVYVSLLSTLTGAGCGRFGVADAELRPLDAAPAPPDATPPPPDAAGAACLSMPSYVTIAGAPSTYLRLGGLSFADALATCATDGAHLLMPDDRAEAAAVFATLPDAYFWVGVTDIAQEGVYVSVLGDDVVDVLAIEQVHPDHALWWWSPATQPDDSGDCLSFIRTGLDSGAHLDDANCDSPRGTLCECE